MPTTRHWTQQLLKVVQISDLLTSTSSADLVQASTVTSTISTFAPYASSSASFFGGASSFSKVSPEAKTQDRTGLGEKERKRLMPLQDDLIIACERGILIDVHYVLDKGAISDLPNKQGKNPLYCAVWGMNLEVVTCLIERRRKNATPISWIDCLKMIKLSCCFRH